MQIVYTLLKTNKSDECHDSFVLSEVEGHPLGRFDFAHIVPTFFREREECVLKRKPPRENGALGSFFDFEIFFWRKPLVDIPQDARDEGVAADGHAGDGGQGLAQEFAQFVVVLKTGFDGNFL